MFKGLCGDDLADQIVIVSFSYLNFVYAANSRSEARCNVVDKDVTVDLLRLAFESALEQKIRFQ